MEKGLDPTLQQSGSGRDYEAPELVTFGTVGELTLGPNGVLTDGPFGGYSFAE